LTMDCYISLLIGLIGLIEGSQCWPANVERTYRRSEPN
jgi:hypothetical protein